MKESQARSRYGSAGIPGAAPLVPADDSSEVGLGRRIARGLVSWFRTAAVTLGVMYVVGWVAITLTVAGMNAKFGRTPSYDNTISKGVMAEVARPYRGAIDPAITPDQAGRAFMAMMPPEKASVDFPRRPVGPPADVPWRAQRMDPGMFPTAQRSNWNGPRSTGVLEAVAAGISRQELEYLRMVATAPVWREFDIVARAGAADLLGARFETPFTGFARGYAFPILRFAATREMANAGVSRAAYQLAIGQRAEAERVLRSVISFGFVLKDNASVLIEELIGDVVIGVGRDALTRFYDLTNDPRGATLTAAHERAVAGGATGLQVPPWPAQQGNPNATRDALIALVGSSNAPNGLRYEALHSLAYTTCNSVGELVLGPGADVRAAFDGARRSLARYSSEVAYIDLIERTVPGGISEMDATGGERVALDAIGIAERIFFNPRLGTCLMRGLGGGF